MRGYVNARLLVLSVTLPACGFGRFIVVENFQDPAYRLEIFRAMCGQVQQGAPPCVGGLPVAYQCDVPKFRRLPVIDLVRDKAARPESPEQVVEQLALFGVVGQDITGGAVTVGFFDQLTGKHIAFLGRSGS